MTVQYQGVKMYKNKKILTFGVDDNSRIIIAWFGKLAGFGQSNLAWITECMKKPNSENVYLW